MVFDPLLLILAFLTDVVDIIFGMGFGLTMAPILLFLNYTPKEIVPALLLSSLIGNILSSFFNHRLKVGEGVEEITIEQGLTPISTGGSWKGKKLLNGQ